MTRQSTTRLLWQVAFAVVVSGAAAFAAAPGALWIEGEAFTSQAGSVGPDRPPFGSRGACLGSNWAGRKGDFVVYRFQIQRPLPDATLYLRYARQPESDSCFDLFLDGKPGGQRLRCKSTAGWGHLRDDEWAYQAAPLGTLSPGWHELKLVSLADENNTNLDGFFLAGPAFDPPTTRSRIEAFRQPPVRANPNVAGPAWVDDQLVLEDFVARLDDWYYPEEEPAQRAALRMPRLVEIAGDQVALASPDGKQTARLPVGGEWEGWRLAETLADPQPMAVLEREHDRWGLIVYLDRDGVVAEVRKAVGRLDKIQRPLVRFPADYFERLLAAKEDVLAGKVLASGRDPCYEDVAAYLAPLQSYTFLGSPQSPNKYVVQPDGSIGTLPKRWGANKSLETTLFDPSRVLPHDDLVVDPVATKRGLLGGYLPAVNYGFWDAEKRFGWELSALMDTGESGSVFIRVRRSGGQTDFYRLEPLEQLDHGKPFYAALLRLKQSWQQFFDQGMQLDVGDARVEDAARAGIVRALCGCVGLHPKYGMGGYWGADDRHDGFPPTTLSLCTCLLDWGFPEAAGERLGYYLQRFVKPDGTLTYYGPAVAEYGQLLARAAAQLRATGDPAWLTRHRPALDAIAGYLLRLRRQSLASQSPDAPSYGLLFGGAEADTRKDTNYYFSGSAWCWRGFVKLGRRYVEIGERRDDAALAEQGRRLLEEAKALREDVLRAAERSVITSGERPFLPPIAGLEKPFQTMTQDRLASYTNYRYWLETLSARCLAPEYERMILDYRAACGGELLAMTRFTGHLDDWPFWHQAYGLMSHDRVPQYLLGYYAHMAHHQMPGTFTAYEQVPIRGYAFRREQADYCVPAQLTTAIMTRWMLVFEEPDAEVLWLLRAAPRAWLENGLSFSGALTRWGRVGMELEPSGELGRMTARITLDGEPKPTIILRIGHRQGMRITTCEAEGAACACLDAQAELVRLKPEARAVTVTVAFGMERRLENSEKPVPCP